jgi:hypothetical protein
MKTLIASAILALFAGSAMATSYGGISAAQTAGSASVVSGSVAGAASSRNGVAISGASNSTQASASVGASDSAGVGIGGSRYNPTLYSGGSASVSGDVATSSKSTAFNLSAGSATGGAAAGGAASADAAGKGFFVAPGVGGAVKGSASSDTANAAVSGRNGFATVKSGNAAGFDASADATKTVSNWGRTTTLDANTSAGAYSVSTQHGFDIGNSFILNTNGGTSGAGAVAGGAGTVLDR